MLSKWLGAVAIAALAVGTTFVLSPQLMSVPTGVGDLRGGCQECLPHTDVCQSNSINCRNYDGDPSGCAAAMKIVGYSNAAYACSGPEAADCCEVKDTELCRKYYQCYYDADSGVCDEPFLSTMWLDAWWDCDDDPPC